MGNLTISPEGLELANAYLECGSIQDAAARLGISNEKASALLDKSEVKRYIDNIYMDSGYRNRFKLGALLDVIIESKLEEARDSEHYSSKDLVDILALVHKIRIEEAKIEQTNIKNQTNIQINDASSPFGSGNYGALMKKLLGEVQEADIIEE